MNRRYILRLIALSVATVLAIWFLADALTLAWILFHFGGHLPLFVKRWDLIGTAMLGIASIRTVILYLQLAKQKPSAR